MKLNSRQLEAVKYLDGSLLVLAGAGSGKTRVITAKIAYLIKECDIAARHITAVTFTNKAAREMKERVAQHLSAKESRGLQVSTFHTLGLKILKQSGKHLGYKPGFSIFDTEDSLSLLLELMRKDYGDDGEVARQVLWHISNWKSNLIDEEQAIAQSDEPSLNVAALLYAAYQRHLKTYNAVDFDDLIYQPIRLFKEHHDVLEKWQNKTRYMLIDEYQDTNYSQYTLVKLLAGVRGAFTVVGDDDQSIYAWRGARPENMRQLKDEFPQLKVIKLEQNYRSSGCILKSANKLIDNNPHVFKKTLWSELGYGDSLRAIRTKDEEHEAQRVVSEIISHRFKYRTDYKDYAILYRGNHQSRLFEKALREQNIPYYLSGGKSFFANAEIRDIMAYLRLLVNPDDDAAFLRIVNTPRREIGPNTVEKLAGYANERNVSLHAACFELGLQHILSERAHARVLRFAEWLSAIEDTGQRSDPIVAVKELIASTSYEAWLQDTANTEKAAERKINNVHDLVAWMQRVYEQHPEDKSLSDLVSHMALMDVLERGEEERSDDRLHMMTLHAAKGLEFPHVFLVGMEEGLLPHRTSIEEENIEEERRLAYVGITRAQKTLTFSMANKRKRQGERVDCEPSRFLSEIHEDDLAWEGEGEDVCPVKRQEKGQAHLANLRTILGEK